MSIGRRVAVAALVIMLAGCGTETGPVAAGLNGSFGGRMFGVEDFLGLSLRESGGVVTGSAWSGIAPTLDHGARVTGSLAGNVVTLRLEGPAGQPDWFFNGTWEADSLRGEVALVVGRGFDVALGRIDTIPTGTAAIAVRGAETGDATGRALFGYEATDGYAPALVIETDAPFAAVVNLKWPGRVRPGVGDAPLGASSRPTVQFVRDPNSANPITYTVTGGTLRIEHSNRFTLSGRVELTARSPSGGVVTVTGTYSAGCVFGFC